MTAVPNHRCPNCGQPLDLDAEITVNGVADIALGRPSRCTPALTESFLAYVAEEPFGKTRGDMAAFLGITEQTLTRVWIKRGRAGEEPYATFVATILAATKAGVTTYSDFLGSGGLLTGMLR